MLPVFPRRLTACVPFSAFARAPLLCVALALGLASCQSVDRYVPQWRTFGVYKLDINQGNYLTQDMVDKLKVGMSSNQVKTVLGTPMLADPFHADRWDYVYRFTHQGKLVDNRAFRVYFVDQKLARWEGDEMPQSAVELNRVAAEQALGQPSAHDDKSWFDRIRGIFTRD